MSQRQSLRGMLDLLPWQTRRCQAMEALARNHFRRAVRCHCYHCLEWASARDDASETCRDSGSPLREFLHVDDLGEAAVFALEKWDPSADGYPKDQQGEPLSFLNVGTAVDLSIRQLADTVGAAAGFSGRINWYTSKPDGTPKKQLDVSRLKELGWQAKISLQDGLNDTIQAFVNSSK